jgi:hypothetical protein
MPLKFKAKIDQYFHGELIETLAHQTGRSDTNLHASIYFSILATVHQVKFRLQEKNGALLTYKMAKVAAGSEVIRHLPSLFNKQVRYQGIINMTSVLFNGDFSNIEKMLQERFGLSVDESNRILIMSTCGTISILGETIREKKLRIDGFREMINQKIPVYSDALSSNMNFPFEHWEAKAAELQNQFFRTENRRTRSIRKKSLFKFSFKWGFVIATSLIAFVYLLLL